LRKPRKRSSSKGRAALWAALLVCHPVFASTPLLSYSTYLAGASARAIAVDSTGAAYVGLSGSVVKLDPTGARILTTYSLPNIAVTCLALDSSGNLIAAGHVVVVADASPAWGVFKFDPAGKLVQTLTPPINSINGLAVDASGNIYLAGTIVTAKGNATTTPVSNTEVIKISPVGNTIYTFGFGGSQDDTPQAIALDSSGDAYVAGGTLSPDFPVTSGAAQSKYGGGASAPGYGAYGDGFLVKIDPTGSKLLFATYWGGSSSDVAYALAVDSTGAAYIAGATSSPDFPTTPSAFQPQYAGPPADPTAPNPAGDAFIAKFSATGAPIWSTYWGGASADIAYGLALDLAGNVYFAGTTESFADFPRAGTGVPTCRQTGGPFVAVLDPTGSKLIRASGMAGLGYDNAYALALDPTGAVYLAGSASSRVFFATPGAAQTAYAAGTSDAFAARLDFTQSGIFAACVLNGASFAAGNTAFFPTGTVAPGEIVSIFGASLGPAAGQGLALTPSGSVSSSLAGVSVAFDGIPAPLLYVSAGQINAVIPYGIASATTAMTVLYNGQSYGPVALPVAAAVPAIFTAAQTGHGQAAVLNQDGALNSVSNPAARGSIVTFFAAGAGAMSPPVSDGAVSGPGPALPVPALPVTVSIRGVDAAVQYAGAAPLYISGLLQVNVTVPTSIDFGNLVPLTLNIGNFSSQLNVTIALK
jgi:uncharacterized protein (TIGR03437 family)